MAVISGALAPFVGRLVDRTPPRFIAGFGLLCCSVSLFWMSQVIEPDVPIWQLLLPIALLGVANGFMWAPIGTTATRNLPMHQAGAGAGVYNTTRQVGAVLGSAGIAVLMESRLAHNLPAMSGGTPAGEGFSSGRLPEVVRQGFSDSMAQSLLLPALVLVAGLIAALLFVAPSHLVTPPGTPGRSTDDRRTRP
jgi:MFS family permease